MGRSSAYTNSPPGLMTDLPVEGALSAGSEKNVISP